MDGVMPAGQGNEEKIVMVQQTTNTIMAKLVENDVAKRSGQSSSNGDNGSFGSHFLSARATVGGN
ncbi:hypothetical protein KIN20_007732 [Parelaphostrongylus tenuis]|uniref:Uncharacterized protein n=1 Tax=Parelaphostrongylus tenuis TaxID=148309 RepID=A0AAD5M5V3_PARTN|nr:hypothetical protein KIN20_007732 [Parelaphostrongylus tenuis]